MKRDSWHKRYVMENVHRVQTAPGMTMFFELPDVGEQARSGLQAVFGIAGKIAA